MNVALQASNSSNGTLSILTQTSHSGNLKILNSDIVADSTSTMNTAQSNAINLSTSGLLKANDSGYAIDIAGNNYNLSGITANLKVNRLLLTGVTIDASGNIYGNTVVPGAVNFTTSNKVIGDQIGGFATVQSSATDLSSSGNLKFNANGYNQTFTTLSSTNSNNDANNYNFTGFTALGNYLVTQKSLSAIYTASNKVFDGSTTATVTGVLTDVIAGDTVSPQYTSANFDSTNVGTNKTVIVSGLFLNGQDSSNYKLDSVVNAGNKAATKANITAVIPSPPTPVIPRDSSSTVKVLIGSSNPFALASAEDLVGETCSANALEYCYCEESPSNRDIDICYEPHSYSR